jgi:hypothetical protein
MDIELYNYYDITLRDYFLGKLVSSKSKSSVSALEESKKTDSK